MLILTVYDSSKGITALEGQQVWSLFQTTGAQKLETLERSLDDLTVSEETFTIFTTFPIWVIHFAEHRTRV